MELSESDYQQAAAAELGRLLAALDAVGEDLDVELSSDILTVEFRDGERCVINSHRAARQIWMAANRSAWHFDLSPEGTWLATKTREELWAVVAKLVSSKLHRPIELGQSAR